MTSNVACYKCGAYDHVATNRNCPRPRKHPNSAHLEEPEPSANILGQSNKDAINEARFWYYPEEPHEVPIKLEEDIQPASTWKMSDPRLLNALSKHTFAPRHVKQSTMAAINQAAETPRSEQPEQQSNYVSKDPPVFLHQRNQISLSQWRANALSSQRDSEERAPKRRRAPKLADLIVTPEFLEWCDEPENDPFSEHNWKQIPFNYMGSRNSVTGEDRVVYQRNLQGWRECRSMGKGLGQGEDDELEFR